MKTIEIEQPVRSFEPAAATEARLALLTLMRDRFVEAQRRNSAYSMRAFARRLNLPPPILSEILRGKRIVTFQIASRICSGLELNELEANSYLERIPRRRMRRGGLVDAARELAQHCAALQLHADVFDAVADWYYFAILSLAETQDFVGTPSWIANRLGITLAQSDTAIGTLERLGLMERDPSGCLTVTGRRFSSGSEIPSSAIKKNHRQGLQLAETALDEVAIELRDFSAVLVACDPSRLPEVKEKIKSFRRELSTMMEGGEKKEVYRLAIQLFPISKPADTTQSRGGSHAVH